MNQYLTWQNPIALHGLWLLPILPLLTWWAVRKRQAALRAFLGRRFVAADWRWHWRRHIVKGLLFTLALLLLVLAAARPRVGTEMQKVKRQGVDVVLLIDTSDSMLAQDVRPSRLEAAKEAALALVARLQPGDRVGLVVFAGSAYLYSPLTIDHDAASMFISSIERGSAPAPGTALQDGFDVALRLLQRAEHPHKAIVLFTDGEDHPGVKLDGVSEARRQDVRVHAVGLGSTDGEPIPVPASEATAKEDMQSTLARYFGAKPQDAASSKFKLDKSGKVVLTRLNAKMLADIAKRGDGVFVRSSATGANVDRVAQALSGMEGAVSGTYEFNAYAERFQWPLGCALLLLVLDGLIGAAPRKRREQKHVDTA